MCGIFGYVGKKSTAPELVLESLKKLEYRGYDSWGIGITQQRKIILDKHVGKIGQAQTKLRKASLAFGHTRWATHGGVTVQNAHPHCDCQQRLAVIHNGVIENFWQLKKQLSKKHQLISETDTELMAHLIEDELKKHPFVEAVRQAFLKLKGLSAFVVMDAQSQQLVAIKNGSPLVIGLGDKENYLASDANCLSELTKKIIYLADNQMAVVSQDQVQISQVETGQAIPLNPEKIDWQVTQAKKGHYAHFMLKEIHEQPAVLSKIKDHFDPKIKQLAEAIKAAKKIYLVGCGSAYHAAIASSYLFAKIAHLESTPVVASEFASKEPFLNKESLVIFFSQSGETIDIVTPLKRLKASGIKTVGIVNVVGSTLHRLADLAITLEAGPEICVLSSKALTTMISITALTSYQLANKLNTGKKDLAVALKDLQKILTPAYQRRYLDPVVKKLTQVSSLYGIGRGLSFPIILETALKIKEVTYLHMEGFPSGELKHGVIALIDQGTPCFVLAPHDETQDLVLSGAMEIKARGGYLIGLSNQKQNVFDAYIPIQDAGEFSMLGKLVASQLIAYKLALHKGYDPDKPRNLAKSVTVV